MVIAMFRTTCQMPATRADAVTACLAINQAPAVMHKLRYPGVLQRVDPDGARMST